jgi:hypothetical protein
VNANAIFNNQWREKGLSEKAISLLEATAEVDNE